MLLNSCSNSVSKYAVAGLLAVALAGCGPSMPADQSWEQMQKSYQSAEDAIKAVGKLDKKSYGPLGSAWSVKLDRAKFDEQLIANLKRLDRVSEFLIPGATITDAQLEEILSSPIGVYFNNVDLSGTGVTDAGVKSLAGCKYLQKANIKGTKISDAFLADLKSKRKNNPDIPAQCRNPAFAK